MPQQRAGVRSDQLEESASSFYYISAPLMEVDTMKKILKAMCLVFGTMVVVLGFVAIGCEQLGYDGEIVFSTPMLIVAAILGIANLFTPLTRYWLDRH